MRRTVFKKWAVWVCVLGWGLVLGVKPESRSAVGPGDAEPDRAPDQPVALAAVAAGADEASDKDYKAFEGEWRFVSIQADGNDLPAETFKTSRLICKGRDFTAINPDGTSRGTFSLDATKSPKTIEITVTEGPEKGEKFVGIYELKGDTYKLCGSFKSKERPRAFESKPGSGQVFEVLERHKEKS
jgi:uncharacterized protein (TIGR03067 family)